MRVNHGDLASRLHFWLSVVTAGLVAVALVYLSIINGVTNAQTRKLLEVLEANQAYNAQRAETDRAETRRSVALRHQETVEAIRQGQECLYHIVRHPSPTWTLEAFEACQRDGTLPEGAIP